MNHLKPISLKSIIWIFGGTLIPILLGVYVILPVLVVNKIPFFVGYLICFQTIPFLIIFFLAIALYKKEGNPLNWKAFQERMRLKFNGKILISSIGLLLFGLITYFLLQSVTKKIASTPFFAPPSWFGAGLHPLKTDLPGNFMGMPLAGAIWAPIIYLIGWFFNITGEELLFRGYLIPRMELTFANKAWLINGVCWWLWHCFWRWQMVALLPFIFLLPLVAQKTKSTIPGMFAHGIMNFISIILISLIVFR